MSESDARESNATEPGGVETLVDVGEAPAPDATDTLVVAKAALGQASADTGQVGGRYALETLLGRGGMGEVWSAHDSRLQREVALKRIQRERPGASVLGRFLREAQLTGKLDHPNIVSVHELGIDEDGSMFFTMKRVRGRSVAQLVEAGEAGSLVRRLDIFRKVCDAIAFAHDSDVLHRDLKPDNVMVGEFGEVIVLDWGLAKSLHEPVEVPSAEGNASTLVEDEATSAEDAGAHLTRGGAILGTPAFMSPEQAEGLHDALDARTDIYALGALLYYLLTDQPPFSGSLHAVLLAVAEGEFVPPSVRAGQRVPRELDAIVRKAMAREPDARYPSVSALRDDVQAYLEGRAVSVMSDGPYRRAAKWASRHRRVVTAVGVTAALGAVGLAAGGVVYLREVTEARDHAIDSERVATVARDRAFAAERVAAVRLAESEVALAATQAANGELGRAHERLAHARLLYEQTGEDPIKVTVVGSFMDGADLPPVWSSGEEFDGGWALSPDGDQVLLRRTDGRITLVDWPTGEVLAERAVEGTSVAGVHTGDRVLMAVAQGGAVQIVDVRSGELVRRIEVDAQFAAFSPDATVLITNALGTARGWLVATGEPVGPPIPDLGWIRNLSTGGRWFAATRANAVARSSDVVAVWDLHTGQPVHEVAASDGAAAVSSDGRFIAHQASSRLSVSEIASGRVLWASEGNGDLGRLRISDDGSRVVGLSAVGRLRTWRMQDGTPEIDTRIRGQNIGGLSRDGAHLLTLDEGVHVWPLGADPPHRRFSVQGGGGATSLAMSSDGVFAASSGWDGTMHVWELGSQREVLALVGAKEGARHVSFSSDSRMAVTSERDGRVRVWDLVGRVLSHELDGGQGVAMASRFLPGDEELLTTYENGTLLRWNLRTGDSERLGTTQYSWDFVLSPDASSAFFAGRATGRDEAFIWDLAAARVSQSTPDFLNAAYRTAIAADGRLHAVGNHVGTPRVWPEGLEGPVVSLPDHTGPVMSVAVSPDMKILATGAFDGQVRLWNTSSWEEIHAFALHKNAAVVGLAFSPGGERLVSLDGQGFAFVFTLDANERLAPLDPAATATGRLQHLARWASTARDWKAAARYCKRLGRDAPPLDCARAQWMVGNRARFEAYLDAGRDSLSPGTIEVWRAGFEG